MDKPLARIEAGDCAAEIYDTALPGRFTVRYVNAAGDLLAEEELSGVSSYKQREEQITQRLRDFCSGKSPRAADLSDSGEY